MPDDTFKSLEDWLKAWDDSATTQGYIERQIEGLSQMDGSDYVAWSTSGEEGGAGEELLLSVIDSIVLFQQRLEDLKIEEDLQLRDLDISAQLDAAGADGGKVADPPAGADDGSPVDDQLNDLFPGEKAADPPADDGQSLDDRLPGGDQGVTIEDILGTDPNPMNDMSSNARWFPPGFILPGVAGSDDPEAIFSGSNEGFPPGLHHINPYSIDPTGGDAGGGGYSQGQAPPGVHRGPGVVMPNPEGGGPEGPAARGSRASHGDAFRLLSLASRMGHLG